MLWTVIVTLYYLLCFRYIAVYFEQGEDDKCVEVSELAVEKGREMRADFKLIAR